ncbi:hypothetical protein ACJ79_gp43 [Propionibacterium phage PHL199M00]|uniref:Uncharacterized protein n=1 Tax=Propionibacterium phage PHL199M00 TaxID=1500830 RepID=A0A0E3DNR9_9CAUD|nr:hypothetical protein ACJ79_gp43 [Propionibacterium phage PHL199M00]AII30074.1 hypothetical protein PHL199M00_43 [Propionibacterium phage PHL199M00]
MSFTPCDSCAWSQAPIAHSPHSLHPCPLYSFACAAEGVRRVTLKPLTPGKT